MLALRYYRTEYLCHLCGLPKETCRSIDTDGNVDVTSERCHVTTALSRRQTADHKAEDVEHVGGLAYSATVKR